MTTECVFCRIAAGDIPADVVHRTERVTAFRDLDPQAPSHILVVPNLHLDSLLALDDPDLAAELLASCSRVAREEGLADDGFRVVANVGRAVGQSVDHLHLHVLGGRPMRWPPG